MSVLHTAAKTAPDRPSLDQPISGFSPYPFDEPIAPPNAQETESLLHLCDTTRIVARGIGSVLRLVANSDAEGSNALRPNTVSALLALCRFAADTLADEALCLQDSIDIRPVN